VSNGAVEDRSERPLGRDGLADLERGNGGRDRGRRDFAASDAIRDRLKTAGVIVEDTPSGTRFTLRNDG